MRRTRLDSSAARRATAGLALATCLPLAPGCGRWGYGALPELEAGSGAGVSSFAPPDEAPEDARLDAGGRLLGADTDTSFAPAGWLRDARALRAADTSSIVDAGAPRAASCDALPPLTAVPTIDGRLEPGLAVQRVQPAHWTGTGSVPAGHALSFAAAWHAQGLYFYLEIEDPDRNPADTSAEAWQGDGVEVYVDHDAVFAAGGSYDDPGTRQLIFTAPPDDVQHGERADAYLSASGRVAALAASDWITTPTPSGYTLELSVSAADLGLGSWTLAAGAQVGFDLAHNISTPPGEAGVQGNRAGQYFLRVGPETDAAFYPFQSSAVFCAPTLLP